MFLDLLFQIWRRLSGHLQWWSLWLFSSKFMVSVSGVVFDQDGRILLQRHRHWVADVWGLPGGIVQRGETLEAAFTREVFEETGLALAEVELLRVVSDYRLRVEVYYRARLAAGVNPLMIRIQPQEILEARFFPPNELPPDMFPLQRDLIALASSRETG